MGLAARRGLDHVVSLILQHATVPLILPMHIPSTVRPCTVLDIINYADPECGTALHCALQGGHESVCLLLLQDSRFTAVDATCTTSEMEEAEFDETNASRLDLCRRQSTHA